MKILSQKQKVFAWLTIISCTVFTIFNIMRSLELREKDGINYSYEEGKGLDLADKLVAQFGENKIKKISIVYGVKNEISEKMIIKICEGIKKVLKNPEINIYFVGVSVDKKYYDKKEINVMMKNKDDLCISLCGKFFDDEDEDTAQLISSWLKNGTKMIIVGDLVNNDEIYSSNNFFHGRTIVSNSGPDLIFIEKKEKPVITTELNFDKK